MIKVVRFVFLLAFVVGCSERDKNGNLVDTPTSGTIKVSADEALKPLIDAEIRAFEGLYRYAKIEVDYMSEKDAIEALLNDSARLCIVTRRLVESETNALMEKTIVPQQLKMAAGGLAVIANRQYADTLITLGDIKKILRGDIKTAASKAAATVSVVVFERPNSGTVRFLKDSITAFDTLPDYCYAVESNSAVVEYVSKTPDALGLIDVSWISDRDDSTSNSFLDAINVLAVSSDSGFFQPHQAYIAQKKYPLIREIFMISREARSGLASGFMAFVASDKGQRIVLKSGLVPATMPIRIVEVNHEPF